MDEKFYLLNHAWRCDGPCRNEGPAYGVMASKNDRAPRTKRRLRSSHQNTTCNGTLRKLTQERMIELFEQHDGQVPEVAAFMGKLIKEIAVSDKYQIDVAKQRQHQPSEFEGTTIFHKHICYFVMIPKCVDS